MVEDIYMLDTVVRPTGTDGLVVNNINLFQDGQRVDQYDRQGGEFIATIEIMALDLDRKVIRLTCPYPRAAAAGNALYVGGAGQVPVGLW